MRLGLASRVVAPAFALLVIAACGTEPPSSVHTSTATTAPVTSSVATTPSTTITAPTTAPKPNSVVISDKLALERLPEPFEPVVVAEQTTGRHGERMAQQLFGDSVRHGSVTVWIVHGRAASELLTEPSYAPSSFSAQGLSLFEYQNRTTLTSNVLAWAIAPDVVVGVTSRVFGKAELLEWIPLITARP